MKDFIRIRCFVTLIAALCILSPATSFGKPSTGELRTLEKLRSPEAISGFMLQNFKFVKDDDQFQKQDYWQSTEEFWKNRAGDCEDFALFAQAALKRVGIETRVVSLYAPGGYAHTVAIFRQNGTYHVMNDGRLYRYDALTIEEALTRVRADWTWASQAELRNSRGWSLLEIRNPLPARNLPSANAFADLAT